LVRPRPTENPLPLDFPIMLGTITYGCSDPPTARCFSINHRKVDGGFTAH